MTDSTKQNNSRSEFESANSRSELIDFNSKIYDDKKNFLFDTMEKHGFIKIIDGIPKIFCPEEYESSYVYNQILSAFYFIEQSFPRTLPSCITNEFEKTMILEMIEFVHGV